MFTMPVAGINRSLVKRCRQFGTVALAVALLGCSSKPFETLSSINPFAEEEDESQRGRIGFVRGFLGGVATDEPRATLIGRDILSSGGTAVDAAVAISLALSVTLPSSAAMGGGGVCVVNDFATKKTETLDFRPGIPATPSAPGTYPVAVPGLIRGLAVLHAKYGRLPWAQLVSPAENLARFGNRVSRALGDDIKQTPPTMRGTPEFSRLFASPKGGGTLREGDVFKQPALSSVLGRLRARGAGDFYVGRLARQMAEALQASGVGLTYDDLRQYAPRWSTTLRIRLIQNLVFHFPAIGSPPGVISAQLAAMLLENGKWDGASPEMRAHLFAEISSRVYGARGQWLRRDGTLVRAPSALVDAGVVERLVDGIDPDRHQPQSGARGVSSGPDMGASRDSSATGFVVADREGNGVACALTMNGLFGSGRIVSGMDIVLAAPPGDFGRGSDALAVMLLVDSILNTFHFAAAASGGAVAPGALIGVSAHAIAGDSSSGLEPAIAAKRVLNMGIPDLTQYEQGLPADAVDGLRKRGHRVSPVPAIGLVNAIFCPSGIPSKRQVACAVRADPRGFGLASDTQ